MAWTNPPTFSTDDVLTATNLNILSDDLAYLHGYVSGANPAMTSVELAVDGDAYFIIRHLHRYLRISYRCNADIKIWYDATEVYHDGTPDGVNETRYADLNALGLTVGQLYTVKATLDSDGGEPRFVFFMYESDVNTE
jgi:hypothetical protein